MPHRSRLEQYRRRRQRSAARNRSAATWDMPRCCQGGSAAAKVFPLGVRAAEGGFQHALWDLACRLCAYSGIHGLLYQADRDEVVIWVIAPRPMAKPLRVLAVTWAEEFRLLNPAFLWSIRVSDTPPLDTSGFRCLFWRTG